MKQFTVPESPDGSDTVAAMVKKINDLCFYPDCGLGPQEILVLNASTLDFQHRHSNVLPSLFHYCRLSANHGDIIVWCHISGCVRCTIIAQGMVGLTKCYLFTVVFSEDAVMFNWIHVVMKVDNNESHHPV